MNPLPRLYNNFFYNVNWISGHNEAVTVFSQQMLELHRGQGMEIYWRDNFICPTEEEYRQMIDRKTGGLFNLAVRLMQLFSSSNEDFTHLTSLLGLYFQIRDDFANLKLESYAANKSFAEVELRVIFRVPNGIFWGWKC